MSREIFESKIQMMGYLWNLLGEDIFLSGFLANLLASFFIAGLFTVIFVRLINYYTKPKLKLVYHKNFNQDFDWVNINIRNNGKTSLKTGEICWHLYIPQGLNFEFLEEERYKSELAGYSDILKERHTHYRNYNFHPAFPEREIEILKLKLNDIRSKKIRIYYHFSSALGMQPRRIWRKFWFRKIARKDGEVNLEFLPHIKVDYSKEK